MDDFRKIIRLNKQALKKYQEKYQNRAFLVQLSLNSSIINNYIRAGQAISPSLYKIILSPRYMRDPKYIPRHLTFFEQYQVNNTGDKEITALKEELRKAYDKIKLLEETNKKLDLTAKALPQVKDEKEKERLFKFAKKMCEVDDAKTIDQLVSGCQAYVKKVRVVLKNTNVDISRFT